MTFRPNTLPPSNPNRWLRIGLTAFAILALVLIIGYRIHLSNERKAKAEQDANAASLIDAQAFCTAENAKFQALPRYQNVSVSIGRGFSAEDPQDFAVYVKGEVATEDDRQTVLGWAIQDNGQRFSMKMAVAVNPNLAVEEP